jgi:hypothetical protein
VLLEPVEKRALGPMELAPDPGQQAHEETPRPEPTLCGPKPASSRLALATLLLLTEAEVLAGAGGVSEAL